MQYELNFNKKTINKQMSNKIESLGHMDYGRKTLQSTFNPLSNTAAVACLNCFFIYNI